MSTASIGNSVNTTLADVRERLGHLFDEVEEDRAASVTAPRKQIWTCGCGQDRVYGLDVPPDVLETSEKMLKCTSCQSATPHAFRCITKTDLR